MKAVAIPTANVKFAVSIFAIWDCDMSEIQCGKADGSFTLWTVALGAK